jgi:hypothetical protein
MVKTATAPLTTVSGKFYVGMTRKEAQAKDLYKSTFSRDFTDIDKDGNGVLDEREICDERDLECSRKKVDGAIATIGTTLAGIFTIASVPVTAGTTLPIIFTAVGCNTAIAAGMVDTQKEKEITDNYRKEHNLDIEG